MAIKRFFHRYILTVIIFLLPVSVFAAVPAWKIIPKDSTLTFTGMLNNAPTSGEFKSFNGEINFDINKLNESNVRITVDINSITTSYPDIANALKTADWFDEKIFPQVIFKATNFTKVGDKSYQANGTLTIRDKTLPMAVTFTQEESTQNKVHVKGTGSLKRTPFGVGRGEWADTDSVGDTVKVDFNITAINSSV